jgi:mono/diheme cytochrome c family protein
MHATVEANETRCRTRQGSVARHLDRRYVMEIVMARTRRLALLFLLPFLGVAAAAAQQRGPAVPLTGDAALDAWVRMTFGQPVEPEALADPVWGTKTLASLSQEQREGARLFMQRCNVCHGAAMNSVTAYGPLLTKKNVEGRVEAARRVIMDGTARMPGFKYGLEPFQITLIIEYLKNVERYAPAY